MSGEEQDAGETEAADAEFEDFAEDDMAEDAEEAGESERRDPVLQPSARFRLPGVHHPVR
jgi:cobaltochelatase CobT